METTHICNYIMKENGLIKTLVNDQKIIGQICHLTKTVLTNDGLAGLSC